MCSCGQLKLLVSVEGQAFFDHDSKSSWGWADFLLRDKALSPAAGFIKNGSMLVGVNISFLYDADQVLSLNTNAIYVVLCESLFTCKMHSQHSPQLTCEQKECPLLLLIFAGTQETRSLHGQCLHTGKYTLQWHQGNL